MIPRMRQSYKPILYDTDGYARFRQYPREVETPIPGAGYDVTGFAWAEQELDLNGGSSPSQYGYGGKYGVVPLRGVGQDVHVDEPSGTEEGDVLLPPPSRGRGAGDNINPVLLWGSIGVGVAALGGLVWWLRR